MSAANGTPGDSLQSIFKPPNDRRKWNIEASGDIMFQNQKPSSDVYYFLTSFCHDAKRSKKSRQNKASPHKA
jgi:hypothetical protein